MAVSIKNLIKEDVLFMLRLNISQRYAKIELNIQQPKTDLKNSLPQIELSTEAAKVEISQPHGQLEIDQSPCRASLGIKNWTEFSRDFADMGRNGLLESVANTVEEGNRLASVEKEPEAIFNISAEKLFPEPAELTIGWIENPIINFHLNPPEINATTGNLDLQLHRGTVENNFQWGKVNSGILQYQSIKFWTTENKYDRYV